MLNRALTTRVPLIVGYLVVIAAVSPVTASSADRTLSMHMVQHIVLVSVAAPLVAAGTRWPKWLIRRSDGTRRKAWLAAWPIAWAAMWLWHIPPLYDAALGFNPLHAFEHLSLFLTWTIAWASIMRTRRTERPVPTPLAVGLLGMTALQSTLLGSLLAFSGKPWFAHYTGIADPLLDQRLGGTIMAVAMGPTQLLITVWLIVQLFDESESTADAGRLPTPQGPMHQRPAAEAVAAHLGVSQMNAAVEPAAMTEAATTEAAMPQRHASRLVEG